MLPTPNRLRRSADFTAVLRTGRRTRHPTMIVYAATTRATEPSTDTGRSRTPRSVAGAHRVGLIVGRSVGNSVVRHRVSRRLRAIMAARLDLLPGRTDLVIRALPPAATADSARLGDDVEQAIARLMRSDRRARVDPPGRPVTASTVLR